MLKIKNLTANIKDLTVIKNLTLTVNPGEVHAVMGAKQSGKSSLVHAILGNPILDIKEGSLTFKRKSIIPHTIDERNILGIFSTFQYLPQLDGITNFELSKLMLKSHKIKKKSNQIEKEYKKLVSLLGLSSNHGHKTVNNETMTPTECKKNELLFMMLLNPKLIVFDEIDKDVEDDELESFATHIKDFLKDKKKSAIIVTHSKRFLDLLEPTHVNIMVDGTIRRKGSQELYKRIVEDDYTQLS
jgi:Fe-S cluster assembly ATP-binding protein